MKLRSSLFRDYELGPFEPEYIVDAMQLTPEERSCAISVAAKLIESYELSIPDSPQANHLFGLIMEAESLLNGIDYLDILRN